MITLRAKKLTPGKFHLFVDIYQNGQREKRYLKIYVSQDYTQPVIDKHGNVVFDAKGQPKARKPKAEDKSNWELANKVRTEFENSLNKNTYGFDSAIKGKTSFTTYFDTYVKKYNHKDSRKAIACLAKFNDFNDNKHIQCNAITESYVKEFSEYLQTNLTGETPHGYFRIFKAVMKQAHKDGLLKTNFAEDVKIKKVNAIRKDILNFGEIQKLHSTPANNGEVKRAFLFSCLTGIRFGDLIKLQWSNIKDNEGGLMLSFNQSKTSKPVNVNLNEDAATLLGKRGGNEDLIFTLPSHTGVLKSLRTWVKTAKVNKKVTFHVARHSFATNLIFHGADLKTASTLLGHSRLDQTNLYAREVEALKQRAVHNLPSLTATS